MSSQSSSGRSAASIWIGCFFLLGFIGILALLTLVLGNVHGEEFSPQTFSVREFSYHRFPITRTRITATQLPAPTGTLACSTDISIHLPAGISSSGTIRWDLADHTIGSEGPIRADASILLTYLRSNHWDQWSTKEPLLAKVLWPAVQQLAIQQCYFGIPELMQGAEEATNPTELKATIDRVSLRSAEIAAKTLESKKMTKEAIDMASWGIGFGKSSYLQGILDSRPNTEAEISQ